MLMQVDARTSRTAPLWKLELQLIAHEEADEHFIMVMERHRQVVKRQL